MNMERFTLEIRTTNEAFGLSLNETCREVARILRRAADTVETGQTVMTLRDANGNSVGGAEFDEEEDD